jgi:hypothetical protein
MNLYQYACVIDYDGQETRHEFRDRLGALNCFTEYCENAATNERVFSVTLENQLTGECVSHWERK